MFQNPFFPYFPIRLEAFLLSPKMFTMLRQFGKVVLTLLREKQRSLACNCHFENKVQQTFSGNYSLARLRLHSLFTTQPDSGRPEPLSWVQALSWDLVLGAMPATADDQQLSKAEGFRRYGEDKKVPASSGQFFFLEAARCVRCVLRAPIWR